MANYCVHNYTQLYIIFCLVKAIPSGIPVSGQGRSLPCMRAGGYLATEKPYVNCLSARKHSSDTAEI